MVCLLKIKHMEYPSSYDSFVQCNMTILQKSVLWTVLSRVSRTVRRPGVHQRNWKLQVQFLFNSTTSELNTFSHMAHCTPRKFYRSCNEMEVKFGISTHKQLGVVRFL